MNTRWFALLPLLSFVVLPYASSQTAAPGLAASALTAVPPLVPYSGQVEGGSGPTTATFLIYKDQTGGEPLFTETQTVAVDGTGRYKVQLGAANPNGLPSDLFSSGEARWLEVQIAGQAVEPRVLLASVPYALKAADAATLGGLPASAFVLAGNAGVAHAGTLNATSAAVSPDATSTVTTTGGSTNKIAKFSGASTIANSILYDNGTQVGIGTTSPTATLTVDGTLTVNGNSTYDGQLVLPATGTATASAGFASQFVKLQTSAYNSSSKSVVPPRFQLQAEVTGNNSASPNATLNLLASATSTPPVETGFYLNTNGSIHFAPSQTFPAISSSGTVSGNSGSGSGVQGTSGSGTGVAGTSTSADGVLGYTGGGTLNTGGVVGQAGGTSGFGGIAGVWGDASAHVGVLGTSSQYAGVQGISSTGQGVQGVSTSSSGVLGTSTSGPGVQGVSTNSIAGLFSTGAPLATVNATNTASNGGQAFSGVAQGSYGIAVYASETGTDGTGVEAFGNGNGVIGDTSGGVLQTAGVLGIAGSRTGIGGIAGVWGMPRARSHHWQQQRLFGRVWREHKFLRHSGFKYQLLRHPASSSTRTGIYGAAISASQGTPAGGLIGGVVGDTAPASPRLMRELSVWRITTSLDFLTMRAPITPRCWSITRGAATASLILLPVLRGRQKRQASS